MTYADYEQIADQLLDAIPVSLWDEPDHRLLDGETPRQAAEHVREAGCMMCRHSLREIAEAA